MKAPRSLWMPNTQPPGSVNTVLFARSRTHFVRDYPGPLSIKTVVEGRVAWKCGRRETWVDDSSLLVLNAGEAYSMDIDFPSPVATACVFFAPGFVETIYAGAFQPMEEGTVLAGSLPFSSCLYPRQDSLLAAIARLRKLAHGCDDTLLFDEHFTELAWQLLLLNRETEQQVRRIPAVRHSTRLDLFRRAARGREFLHANFTLGSIRLEESARAAGMSPFHFQRTFQRAFGCSPSQYVTELRLQRAARLLRAGYEVTNACLDVGFSSLGSFSTAFRRRFGAPPSAIDCVAAPPREN